MNKRLLYSLLVPALAIAGLAAMSVPASSADLRRITVELANGRIIEIVREVTRGTPLEKLSRPARPRSTTPPSTRRVATAAAPMAAARNPSTPRTTKHRPTTAKAEATATRTTEPTLKHWSILWPVEEKKKDTEPEEPELSPTFRNPDGRPSRDNPNLTDAPAPGNALDDDGLPGPLNARAVPNFVINKFQVPIFLLPIYQAAGSQYGVRWEILAAINEVETDYGRNLSTSTAGALGWMQFMPSSWRMYGVDANDDGKKDPYNPVDAIFAAARYLKAAGYDEDVRQSIFAYNHADWYVDTVMMRAKLIAGTPGDLTGSLTGLTEGRFPVYAKAQYADDLSEAEATRSSSRARTPPTCRSPTPAAARSRSSPRKTPRSSP